MKKRNFRIEDAFSLMAWLNEVYPDIFREWVSVRDVMDNVDKGD